MKQLRVLVIGAHPDDADIKCGGLALKLCAAGHIVKFVSLTNGATGHHEIGGVQLARRRYEEAQAAARVAGLVEYEVLDLHTGELEPNVHNRKTVIRIIRSFRPDLVITHRPYDYHPDHRYTSQLVADASYIVTVPNMLPLTPALREMPVICYMYDPFQKPTPFVADVALDISDVLERKIEMLHCHKSQMYEWLPFNRGVAAEEVPETEEERRLWLREWYLSRPDSSTSIAKRYRQRLMELYGAERGKSVQHAEVFEICEYGRPLGRSRKEIAEFFPLD